MKKVYVKADLKEGTKPGVDEQTGTVLKIEWSNGNLLEGEVTSTQASATVTRCGEDVTAEYPASAFNWVRDSGDAEADNAWNAAHAGMKSITCTATDLNGDVKISCTLTASSATYGSITVDDDLDASHTPGELDANDVFVIENGYLKVTTSRGNVYALEDGKVKAAGAKLNGSITAETKLFASQPENMVEFSYDHNGLRTQKKMTKADGTVETTDYTLHGKLITHLTRGSDTMHFFYNSEKRPAMVEFNGTLYSYIHNLQGDIVGIVDSSGSFVVEYKYDAWGKPVTTQTISDSYEVLAELNPFRYRGYVYDEVTELYYLRSRYYNSNTCRFIHADYTIGRMADVMALDMFSYVYNSPIRCIDQNGCWPDWNDILNGVQNVLCWLPRQMWQIVIGGLEQQGYVHSASLLQHSLQNHPSDLTLDESSALVASIRSNEQYKNKFYDMAKRIMEGETVGTESFAFTDMDLFGALHRVNITVSGIQEDGEWVFDVNIHDTYNFQFQWDTYFSSWKMFAITIGNNMAWSDQFFGVIVQYDIDISFQEEITE